jgi:hypothetical protein
LSHFGTGLHSRSMLERKAKLCVDFERRKESYVKER